MTSELDKASELSSRFIVSLVVCVSIAHFTLSFVIGYARSAVLVVGTFIACGLVWVLFSGKIYASGETFGRGTVLYWFCVIMWGAIGVGCFVALYLEAV